MNLVDLYFLRLSLFHEMCCKMLLLFKKIVEKVLNNHPEPTKMHALYNNIGYLFGQNLLGLIIRAYIHKSGAAVDCSFPRSVSVPTRERLKET